MIFLPIIILGIVAGLVAMPQMPSLYAMKAPEATTEAQKAIVEQPPTDAEVIAQIVIEFAEHDRHVIKQAIDVAYAESGLRYNAYNYNTNKTGDYGTFQVNQVHTKRFGNKFWNDYKENIRVAHVIYDEQGWRPWVAAKKIGLVK